MKLLFDQNISHRILSRLPNEFKDSTSVKAEGLINVSDKRIWDFAKDHNYTIVTQDSDFNDLNSLYGFPPKIIWIRTGNLSTTDISQLIISNKNTIEIFISDNQYGCLELIKIK